MKENSEETRPMEKEVNLRDYFKVIVKWRRIIAFNTATITILAVIISLVLPERYTATATLLPPVEQPEVLGIRSLLGGSAFSGAISVGGIPGMATASDVFAKILSSRRVMEGVVRKCNLMDEYGVKRVAKARAALKEATSVEISPEGIIAISVDAKTPVLASGIANAYVNELDRFNQEANMTRGKRNRIFIEERLEKVKKDLNVAEESLKAFQQRHKTVSLGDELVAAIEAAGQLKAKIITKEVELGVLREFATERNPQVKGLRSEIAQLNRQLREMEYGSKSKGSDSKFGAGFSISFAELAAVGLELVRLTREAKIQETVFELLTQEFEQAKIAEARDTPTVQVLDGAVPPERKSFPQRKKFVVIGFIFSLFVGIGLSFFLEYVEKLQGRPKEYEEWIGMGEELKGDMRVLTRRLFRRRKT